jgi:hypothetical protein
MRNQMVTAAAVMALIGGSLSGCGSSVAADRGPEAGRGHGADGLAGEHHATPYPLDAYRLSPEEAAIVTAAAERVLGNCMKAHGFQAPPYVIVSTVGKTSRRYGITDAAAAKTNGYSGSTGHEPQSPPPSYDTPAYQAALGSAGSSGCMGEVTRATGLGQALADGDEQVYQLDVKSFEQARRSPAVQRSIAAWSSCLRKQGIIAADPLSAGARFTRNPIAAAAIAQATADVQCKKSAALVATWTAEDAAAQREAVAANRAALGRIRSAQLDLVDLSRKALQDK